MKHRVTFFLLVTLVVSIAHYLVVLVLSQFVEAAPGIVPVLWVFVAPMNFLLSSSFGRSLSPGPFHVLFTANSLLWGLAIGAVILWRRFRYE